MHHCTLSNCFPVSKNNTDYVILLYQNRKTGFCVVCMSICIGVRICIGVCVYMHVRVMWWLFFIQIWQCVVCSIISSECDIVGPVLAPTSCIGTMRENGSYVGGHAGTS